ncbi:tryptophan halogenase [Pseudoalteromonas atlantica]|uniref:Tryptophan halogenase n=1 Tax=Pseudoalteromonas atlantica TaxID=288 RepID=A0ABQ0UIE5_PSEAF|nr:MULTISPECIES: tryptophan halogenase family protein [unclassified Pseudoalteromonas]TMO09115.1 tryptophan halogenase [Pseudoalteromonas sp. S327]TMO19975.1 tryptophan halogenase [Pseudoalteromonas sp. S326]GEK76804.1 tryptophan halogenase [Pseudoalteromonas atlantica]
MNDTLKSIVIVGGGTAGWLSAGIIAAYLKKHHSLNYHITLVESADIATVGVGEGTWPTMRRTLQNMGVDEAQFINQCNVSFKQGAKFANWHSTKENDFYYHPLMMPQGFADNDLAAAWLRQDTDSAAPHNHFANFVCPQHALCEHNLAPKALTTPQYSGVANYAYHLDAGLFATFLKNHCINHLNVTHVVASVLSVNNNANGDIHSLSLDNNTALCGDLYIDCSGFKSLLLGENLKIGFKSCKDILFADSALAVHMPYDDETQVISSHTISTAQTAGWIWDIGLQTRRGVGHVYSSRHISEQEAKEQLFDYLNISPAKRADFNVKKISFEPGHREKFWHKNCVAIGLSAGFLEPLEASALLLVEISANFIAEQLPANRQVMDITAARFNRTFSYRWQRIIDFLKLHYMLSERTDSLFWQRHCAEQSIPQSLQGNLALWRTHIPNDNHFDYSVEVFPAASYQYVLYGMGFKTATTHYGNHPRAIKKARNLAAKNTKDTAELVSKLPDNRTLLKQIKQYGLQKI